MKTLDELGISPAPWFWANRGEVCICNCVGFCIAMVYSMQSQKKGNANLISAAPELYECLRKAVEFIEEVGIARGGLPLDVTQNQNAARYAIAKAAGEMRGKSNET